MSMILISYLSKNYIVLDLALTCIHHKTATRNSKTFCHINKLLSSFRIDMGTTTKYVQIKFDLFYRARPTYVVKGGGRGTPLKKYDVRKIRNLQIFFPFRNFMKTKEIMSQSLFRMETAKCMY